MAQEKIDESLIPHQERYPNLRRGWTDNGGAGGRPTETIRADIRITSDEVHKNLKPVVLRLTKALKELSSEDEDERTEASERIRSYRNEGFTTNDMLKLVKMYLEASMPKQAQIELQSPEFLSLAVNAAATTWGPDKLDQFIEELIRLIGGQ